MEIYLPLSNVTKRLLTGVVLAAIIIGSVLAGSLGLLILLLVINALALLEFYRLFRSAGVLAQSWGGVISSSFLLVTLHGVLNTWFGWQLLLLGIPTAFMLFVVELYRKTEHPFHNLAFTFLGITWISIPILFFEAAAYIPFAEGSYQRTMVLGYFFILWAADSGAFFVGKTLGRHKLFERISPGKTWEGSIGGAVVAFLVAYVLSRFIEERSTAGWIIMTAIILFTGTYGDFIKSLMKRSLHIKDSGNILPGHGGMLDRFDTLLGSAPFVFLYLLLFVHA